MELRGGTVLLLGGAGLESKHGVRSVAFEMLGPPRLTKLLHEAHIWSRVRTTVGELARSDPEVLAGEGARLVSADGKLRSLIVSRASNSATGRDSLQGPQRDHSTFGRGGG